MRTRTNSHEPDGSSKKPKHARAKSVKRSEKINQNPENGKKIPWDPGSHFPVPYLVNHQQQVSAARMGLSEVRCTVVHTVPRMVGDVEGVAWSIDDIIDLIR